MRKHQFDSALETIRANLPSGITARRRKDGTIAYLVRPAEGSKRLSLGTFSRVASAIYTLEEWLASRPKQKTAEVESEEEALAAILSRRPHGIRVHVPPADAPLLTDEERTILASAPPHLLTGEDVEIAGQHFSASKIITYLYECEVAAERGEEQ